LGQREVPPLGLVKVVTTPEPAGGETKQPPIPPATMELGRHRHRRQPTITKPAKPFDREGNDGWRCAEGTSKKKK